ncbi:MAG TPA: GNAT family N-acetyltransferase [Nocardioides sp.]|jgi:GNAT superfamily N-acetyltransferase|nr:GNAT family N-acetyltransferase [Nocardioides sp.]
MTWHIEVASDPAREDELTDHLVEHNREASPAVRRRFEPGNLRASPVQAFAIDETGELLGGCVGHIEVVWHWLTVDTMWVDPRYRGRGLGTGLLEAVEDQARTRGCRWAKLNTWEFQAPDFYGRLGYHVYGREVDYPPGHTNHLMRREL